MFNFITTHKLQEFVTPLTVYVSSKKAQNPARKDFEKTKNNGYLIGPTFGLFALVLAHFQHPKRE